MSAAGRSPAAAAAAQRTASGSRAGRAAASRAAATGTAGTWHSPCGVRACTRRRSADARRRAGANQELRGDEPMSAPEPPAPRTIPPYELLSEERLVAVERHADQLLDEIGLEIRGDLEAIRLWRAAGARISGEWRVHVPRGLAREIVRRSAPREFTQ